LFRRRVAAVLILALGIALLAACDETEAFVLVNSTKQPVVAEYRIVDRGGGGSVYGQSSYLVSPGGEINTAEVESLSGDLGVAIFDSKKAVDICGYWRGALMYARTFSREEAKAMDFRFEITDTGGTIQAGRCPQTNES